jgi:membrane fusion protein, multidrug efflux system
MDVLANGTTSTERGPVMLWLRRLVLLLVPVTIGAGALIIVRKNRLPPTTVAQGEAVSAARVIEVRALDVTPRAIGYGTAVPARVWEAVAEVSGKAVFVHPRLKRGAILEAGAVLVEIDPAEYKLQVAQFVANVESLVAQIEEIGVREGVDKAIVATEQRSLRLKERDLARQRKLLEQGVLPKADVERTERDSLSQTLKVQIAEKAVALVPAQRRVLAAKLAQAQSQLAEARVRLTHTRISIPLDCRVADVKVELGQFVSKGQTLAVADGIDVTEVHAQFPADDLRLVIGDKGDASLRETAQEGQIGAALQVSALVRFRSGDFEAEWKGRFARVSDVVDAHTRTMGVIVEVPEAYAQSRPGVRPPLVKGMYCEVHLRGQPQADQIVVPRHTLRGGNRVLLLDGDNRLRERAVEVAWCQGDLAVIRKGLAVGEVLVVSDIVPAIEGMRVEPVQDGERDARLAADAAGEALRND